MLHPYQIFYIHPSLSGVCLLYMNTCPNVIAQNFTGTEIIASCHTCIAFYNRAVISILSFYCADWWMQSCKMKHLCTVTWRLDEDVVQKLLTDFCSESRWMKGCSRWVERRAGGEEKGRGERWIVAVGKSDCETPSPLSAIYVLQEVHPFPSFPFSSPSFPLLLHSPLQLASLFFQYFLSACQWLPCPLPGLWLWLSLLHSPPLLSHSF